MKQLLHVYKGIFHEPYQEFPLHQKNGLPDLLVEGEKEFDNFDRCIANIPPKLSKSCVIPSRRKNEFSQ